MDLLQIINVEIFSYCCTTERTRSAIWFFYWLAFWWIAYIKYLRPSILFPFLLYSSNNQSWVCQRIGAPHPRETLGERMFVARVLNCESLEKKRKRGRDREREREREEEKNDTGIDNFVKMRASRSADKTYNNKSRSAFGHAKLVR